MEFRITVQEPPSDSLDASFEAAYYFSPEHKRSLQSFVNVRDDGGQTALHTAASSGNLRAVKTLMEYGASVFVKDLSEKVLLNER